MNLKESIVSSIKKIKNRASKKSIVGTAATSVALLATGVGLCLAQGANAGANSVEGRVKTMTTAPKGEIDGAVLEDGVTLHWPPHLEKDFTKIVKEGIRVRASGRTETTPRGETKFEVASITDTQSNKSVTNDDFRNGPRRPPHPKHRHEPKRGPIEKVSGKVQRLTTAPRGETDGAVLADGTWLHWPPHLEDQFVGLFKVGDEVQATGRRETTPRGDEHFEIQNISNTRDGKSAENPDFRVEDRRGPGRDELPPRIERRLDDLERQIEQLRDELNRLRKEK